MRSILRFLEPVLGPILGNLMETSRKPHKTVIFSHKPSQTAVLNLIYGINQPGTLKHGCILLPLGSPTRVPKQLYEQSVPACRTCACRGVPGWVWDRGGQGEG